MNSDLLKLFAPIVFILTWIDFSRKNRSIPMIVSALFFTSIVAFSQNYVFIYREFHQFIQILMIIFYIRTLIKTNKINKINFYFFIFLFFISISLIFSKIDDDAQVQLVNFIVVVGVTNYLYSSIYSISRLQLLMGFFGRLAIILAIVGLVEFGFNFSQRVEGTFANANYYAFFLGIGYCVVFQTMSGTRRYLGLLLILISIIMSGSRSALIFPLLQFLWYVYRFKSFKSLVFYLFVGGGIVFLIFLSGVTRFSDVQASEGSDAERIIFAKIAYRMADDHPFTGVGWGRYITEFGSYSSTSEQIFTSAGAIDAAGQDRRVTHNDLVRILAELGWLAFVASLVSLFSGFIRMVRNKKHEVSYFFPIWLGVIIFSLTHNNLNGALFWFLFFIPFSFIKNKSLAKL